MTAWLTTAIVVIALTIMTLGVVGLGRLPSVRLRLHAATKVGAVGVVLLSVAAVVAGLGARVLLIALFVLVTTPVSAHVIAASAQDD